MAIDKESIRLYIEEQRRYHDELTHSFSVQKTRIYAYIGAILAVLAFLYSGALDENKTTTREKLFIPDELYGQVFYAFGLFLLLYALGKLVQGARPNSIWTVALQSKDYKKVESKSEGEYLVELKDYYEDARSSNIVQYSEKHEALRDSFYPMLLGAIILVVLRYFQ